MTILVVLLAIISVVSALVWAVGSIKRAGPEGDAVHAHERPDVAVEMHRIRRKLDVAWTRNRIRRDAAVLRREIANVMERESDEADLW